MEDNNPNYEEDEQHLESFSSICHQSLGITTRANQLPDFSSVP